MTDKTRPSDCYFPKMARTSRPKTPKSALHKSLKLIQSASGLCFSLFSLVHLGGHMFANVNFHLADQILFANREVFQYLPYELTMIFGSLAVHGTSSWLLVYKRGTLSPISLNSAVAHGQLHRWSGYILSGLVSVHIAGVRILPLLLLNDPTIVDLSIVKSASRHRPWLFPLYYTVLASTGLYHSLYGASLSLHQFGLVKTRLRSSTWNTICWMCCGISAVTVASICGYWQDIKIVNEPEFEKIHNFITIFLRSRQYI